MNLLEPADRVRALGYFVIAEIYFLFAQILASHSAAGFTSSEWADLVARSMLLFLLLVGYGLMARAFNQQPHPIQEMGLVFRPGWKSEFGRGFALGWGMLVAAILPLVLAGGLMVSFWAAPRQFLFLGADFLLLAIASLAEEVAFRGYPFQRLVEAVGPVFATLLASAAFASLHLFNPGINRVSLLVTFLAGCLFSAAYLRTRALWFSWGCHFAWNASMGLLFGLPISGLTRFSPVVQSNTIGPTWMTGADYGPEGSMIAVIVLLIGIVAVFRITREDAYKYAQPVIQPGGIPVEVDSMGHARAFHDPQATRETLVQINQAGFSRPPMESAAPVEDQTTLHKPSNSSHLPSDSVSTPVAQDASFPGESPDQTGEKRPSE